MLCRRYALTMHVTNKRAFAQCTTRAMPVYDTRYLLRAL